jgi:hypothetical protein
LHPAGRLAPVLYVSRRLQTHLELWICRLVQDFRVRRFVVAFPPRSVETRKYLARSQFCGAPRNRSVPPSVRKHETAWERINQVCWLLMLEDFYETFLSHFYCT